MFEIKQMIKRIYYQILFGSKRVKFDKRCIIGGIHTCFEGHNVIGADTFFLGSIGFGSYIGERCSIKANIGRYCSISNNVQVIVGSHPTSKFVSTHPCFFSIRKQAGFTYVTENKYEEVSCASNGSSIEIGNDVWIGSNVLLKEGVTIGDGAVIAAGAVVVEDVEPYSIVGGVPAKMIRKRFSEEEIAKLMEIKWWTKPSEWVEANADKFDDISEFINYFKL